MDYLAFISKLIDSLSWPIVTLVLGLALRGKLGDLLPSLKKVKAGPVEAEFSIDARRIYDKSQNLLAEKQIDSKGDARDTKIALAKIHSARRDPVKMVLEAWNSVDGALFRLGKDAGILIDPMDSSRNVYERVISSNLLNPQTKELVIEVYEMKNRVSIANIKPSLDSAKDYLIAVEQVINLLEEERKTVEKVGNVTW
ncbi:hypothetical protein [Psychromonas sp.]|uniref:hypothetical protein n=1 Tax=Psychromonas sp. TaxID=1884585 RepID=UPI003A97009A